MTPQADSGVAALTGRGAPGSTIQVLVDNQVVASTIVRNNGQWTATAPLDQPGQHRVTVRAVVNGAIINAASAPAIVDVPIPLPTATPTSVPVVLRLLIPSDGETGTGTRTFEWETDYIPAEGEKFELVFWRPDLDPLTSGYGMAEPTTDYRLNLNLSALDDTLGERFEPGPHYWGILLVRTNPYQRLRLLGEPHMFTYYRASDGGSSSGGRDGGSSGEGSSGESSGE